MKLDVPIRAEDGTISFNVTLDDAQIQSILQFGLNFLVATGMAATYGVMLPSDKNQADLPFND